MAEARIRNSNKLNRSQPVKKKVCWKGYKSKEKSCEAQKGFQTSKKKHLQEKD